MTRYGTIPWKNPCIWPDCREQASYELPLCIEHAVNVWRNVERRGLATNHVASNPPSQYAETAGHPIVYYVEVRPGVVKIGTTAKPIRERVRELRADIGQLLAAEPGGYAKERHRHVEFAGCRIGRREDFHLTDDLQMHMSQLRAVFGEPLDVADSQGLANAEMLASGQIKR